MDDFVVIALFRHGLTEENKRRAYLGWNDSPLCLSEKNTAVHRVYDHYFASDLLRCVNTVKQLFPNVKPTLLQELREMNFGEWEGKTYEDLKDHPLYRKWIDSPLQYSPPNGESIQQFTSRIDQGWAKIVDSVFRNGIESAAVVTHGGVIRYLLTKFAPIEKEFWEWHVPHDQGYELVFEKEAIRGDGRCTLLREVPLTGKISG